MAITHVASSGWYQPSQYSSASVPVPSGAQAGDLVIGVVVSAPAAPPNGSSYSFYGSSGYSLAVSGTNVWVLYRWCTGNDPALVLPPFDVDEWGSPANNAAGQTFLFRGPIESLGVTGSGTAFDDGPSVVASYPTRTGSDTYSLVAISGDEMGSTSVTSNPKNLSFLSEAAFTHPHNLRGFVFGGNISGDSGGGSSITLNITESSNYWESGGSVYASLDPRNASLSAQQASHTLSSSATLSFPERFVFIGSVLIPYPQDNQTLSSSATVTFIPRSAVLTATQASQTLSASVEKYFVAREVSAQLVQASTTLISQVGIYKPLAATLVQADDVLTANASAVAVAALSALQQDHVEFAECAVLASISAAINQENHAFSSLVNGVDVSVRVTQENAWLGCTAAVDVVSAAFLQQNSDIMSATMRHLWLTQRGGALVWADKTSDTETWERLIFRKV